MTALYILLALLSVAVSIGVYKLVDEFLTYRRLHRIKNMIANIPIEDEEILEVTKHSQIYDHLDATWLKHIRLAGIELSLLQLGLLLLVLGSILGLGFALFLKHWSGWIMGLIIAGVLLKMGIQTKALMRKREFNHSFAKAISVVVKMMRNGIGFEQALYKSVMTSNSATFKSLFSQYFLEKNTIGEEEAFANMNKHIDSKELRIFAMAVKIGRQSGGQFSATLDKVEQTLRYRKKMQDKVGVITREGMIGSYMIAGINVMLYFMIDMNFNGKVNEYFFTSEWGRWQLFGIGLWMVAGLAVNRMITRIEL